MGRIIAHGAEVARGGDNPLAKMMLPKSVNDDTGSEWMIGPCQPAAKRGAPASGISFRVRQTLLCFIVAEELGKPWCHGFFRFAVIAIIQDVRLRGRPGAVANRHRRR